MNDKCKYCDYVSKCSRICEYDSCLCKVHRSFPKVVDKSYEQLQQENKQLKGELKYTIGIVEHNRIISEKNKKIHQLKDNWNKLKEYFNERIKVYDNRLSSPFCNFEKATKEKLIFSQCLEKLEELEQGSDSNE